MVPNRAKFPGAKRGETLHYPLLVLIYCIGLGQAQLAGLQQVDSGCVFNQCSGKGSAKQLQVHSPSSRGAHPHLQPLVALQRAADLKGALRRFLRTAIEDQRHAVARGNLQHPIGLFRFLELPGQANNAVELFHPGVLLVNRELGVADYVEEENARYLQLDLFLAFGRH